MNQSLSKFYEMSEIVMYVESTCWTDSRKENKMVPFRNLFAEPFYIVRTFSGSSCWRHFAVKIQSGFVSFIEQIAADFFSWGKHEISGVNLRICSRDFPWSLSVGIIIEKSFWENIYYLKLVFNLTVTRYVFYAASILIVAHVDNQWGI